MTEIWIELVRITHRRIWKPYFWKSASNARKTPHRGSLLLLLSTLTDDNLSDDRDEGIGGTFICGGFDSLSDELLLRNDCKDDFLTSFNSVSLLLTSKIALSGLLLGFFVSEGFCPGSGSTPDDVVSLLSRELADTAGLVEPGSGMNVVGSFCVSKAFGAFASFLGSLRAGEGDLDDEVIHVLLARFLKVLVTERTVEGFDFSVISTVSDSFVSFDVELPRSSAESVNLVTAILPMLLVEALRSSSLLGTYGDCPCLGDPSGKRAKTLSEKVRLMPSVGCDGCAPGKWGRLADRDMPLTSC